MIVESETKPQTLGKVFYEPTKRRSLKPDELIVEVSKRLRRIISPIPPDESNGLLSKEEINDFFDSQNNGECWYHLGNLKDHMSFNMTCFIIKTCLEMEYGIEVEFKCANVSDRFFKIGEIIHPDGEGAKCIVFFTYKPKYYNVTRNEIHPKIQSILDGGNPLTGIEDFDGEDPPLYLFIAPHRDDISEDTKTKLTRMGYNIVHPACSFMRVLSSHSRRMKYGII
jgi:hypothetical protein